MKLFIVLVKFISRSSPSKSAAAAKANTASDIDELIASLAKFNASSLFANPTPRFLLALLCTFCALISAGNEGGTFFTESIILACLCSLIFISSQLNETSFAYVVYNIINIEII